MPHQIGHFVREIGPVGRRPIHLAHEPVQQLGTAGEHVGDQGRGARGLDEQAYPSRVPAQRLEEGDLRWAQLHVPHERDERDIGIRRARDRVEQLFGDACERLSHRDVFGEGLQVRVGRLGVCDRPSPISPVRVALMMACTAASRT